MIGFYAQPIEDWEYKMSEFHQGRVLLMCSPIRFYFGQFGKNASDAEKGKLIHQAQEEKVMCYHLSTGKCLIVICIFYRVVILIGDVFACAQLNSQSNLNNSPIYL